MKQIGKVFTVLLFTLLLVTSAFATINDSLFNPLWVDTHSQSREIFNGSSATFSTGYFGTNLGQVKITATVNSKIDGKIVSYIVKDKVVSMSNGLGYEEFTVTPAHYQNSGEYIIVIKLKDSNSERVDSSLLLKVKNKLIYINPNIPFPVNNHAPIMSDISPDPFIEGETGTFAVLAWDDDNDDLKYTAEFCEIQLWGVCKYTGVNDANIGAYFETKSIVGIDYGVFSWTPDYEFVQHPNQEREVQLRFRANDGQEDSKWQYVTILVKDKNRAPSFSIKGETSIAENQVLVLSLKGTDGDNDNLTYTYSGDHLPGAKLAKNGDYDAALLWKPDFNSSAKSPYIITITVKDGFGGEKSETIIITVNEANRAPVFDPLENKDVFVGNELKFHVTATDKDNDVLTYTAPEKPQEAAFEQQTFIWTPEESDVQNSPHQVTFKVDDGKGGIDQETIYITVVPKGQPAPLPQCSDNSDNDNDGKKDMLDSGCSARDDNDESDDPVNRSQCNDRLDNDGDTKIDLNDPGCTDAQDNDENDENRVNGGQDTVGDHGNSGHGRDNTIGDGRADNNTLGNGGGRADHNSRNDTTTDDGRDDDKTNSADIRLESAAYINIKLKSVQLMEEFVTAGDFMVVKVNLYNNGKVSLKDVKVQVKVYELGIYGSTGEFALAQKEGTSKNVYVFVPQDAEPGLYLVKVTVSDSYYHTSAYRLVFVSSH